MLNENLESLFGKIEVINEDVRPSQGMWYYLYLKPKWVRVIIKSREYGHYQHVDFWDKYIVHKLIDYYALSREELNFLSDLSYSMPRGRVSYSGRSLSDIEIVGMQELEDTWYMDYGNDIPSPLNPESEKRKLISGFNLTGPANNDKVVFRKVPHEMMIPEEQKKMQELIGHVPY